VSFNQEFQGAKMDVIMPKMGESVSEGTIIKWHKKEGDKVKRDEIIFDISTDKVDTEIPSPADGVLLEIKVQEGDTVEVGSIVAVIDENGGSSRTIKEEKPKELNIKDNIIEGTQLKTNQPSAVKSENHRKKEDVKEKESREDIQATKEEKNLIEITMPKMGESVMEGTIIKWYKKAGEAVKKDETLFEISTDKVDTEVPSPESGIVEEILVGEQETVEVGTVVAKLSTGEAKQKVSIERGKEIDKKAESRELKTEDKKEPAFASEEIHERKRIDQTSRFYSPLVMNIAKQENISMDELDFIEGSGLEGRVTKKDILNYIEDRKKQSHQTRAAKEKELATEEVKMQPIYSSNEIEKIEMDNIRQKVMQHMVKSRDTSVHVTAMLEVDMTKIHNYIQKNKGEIQKIEGIKLTYMPFIANAVIKGLKEYPLINSTIEGTTILKKKYINLGIAVAIEPTGLIVPNIKSAGERNLIGLAKAISELAQKSRNKKLTPDDISNGTFTITNYGVFGTLFGTPIINQPEVAILGVGSVIKKPVVFEVDGTDTIAIRSIMTLSLSHDHRLVDGMLGGKFLKFIKDTLESFDPNNI